MGLHVCCHKAMVHIKDASVSRPGFRCQNSTLIRPGPRWLCSLKLSKWCDFVQQCLKRFVVFTAYTEARSVSGHVSRHSVTNLATSDFASSTSSTHRFANCASSNPYIPSCCWRALRSWLDETEGMSLTLLQHPQCSYLWTSQTCRRILASFWTPCRRSAMCHETVNDTNGVMEASASLSVFRSCNRSRITLTSERNMVSAFWNSVNVEN